MPSIILADIDLRDAPLTYTIARQPSAGTLSAINQQTGQVTYTPATNFFGQDSFFYVVNNGTKDSRIVTVHLTVDPVNDPPVARELRFTVGRNRSVEILLEADDPDDYELVYSTVSNPALETLSDHKQATITAPVE